MDKFEFFGIGRMIFGRGQSGRAAELVKALGQSALLIHNAPGVAPHIEQALSSAGISVTSRRQRSEPVAHEVDEAVSESRRSGTQVIIGLGGGSAIDAAKATAALITNGGTCTDYMEVVGAGRKISVAPAPWIAMPTTAGTGAEATRNAVIGLPQRQFKASIRSELMLPRLALIDPELGVEVPPEVTASSGMDALCQLIESYTSIGAQPITDALALQGITLAIKSLHRAVINGMDLDAREDMALAAFLSGITLTNAGLGAVHGFAAPLGANFPVAHGTVCAALLPHVLAANIRGLRDRASAEAQRTLARYATIGRLLSSDKHLEDSAAIDNCIRVSTKLVQELEIPPLSRFGLQEKDVPAMVALARKASSMRFNPVTLDDAALFEALLGAIEGRAAI